MHNNVILSTAYFPPIEYFKAIIQSAHVYIESNENYLRQSYRNRCNILSCNGIQSLSIPIIKSNNIKQNILEVKIAHSTNWKRLHKNAIISAYGKSPFFPYYSDAILNLIDNNTKFLFDFNLKIIENILALIKISKTINKTSVYQKQYNSNFLDLRYSLHPKKKFLNNNKTTYIQTFNDRFDFIPNLSIIDLIFNVGNELLIFYPTTQPLSHTN